MTLKRGRPLRRSTPLRARSWPKPRRLRLKAVSAKRQAERPEREAVRRRALARAGWQCEARAVVPEVACWGPLDVDERTARGVRPGSHLEDAMTQVLCRGHHEWRHSFVAEAEARGLRVPSWKAGRG